MDGEQGDVQDFDPTLHSCCERERQDALRTERLRSALLAVDLTATRLKHLQSLREPPPAPPAAPASEAREDGGPEAAEEDEAELRLVLDRRRAELQRRARWPPSGSPVGTGALEDVSVAEWGSVLQEPREGPVVCHLAARTSQAGAELDEHLAALAARHRHARFLRCCPDEGASAPALVCLRADGGYAAAPLQRFVRGGELWEETVLEWLKGVGALAGPPSLAGGRALRGGASASGSEEGSEDDWREPCAQCGRTYFHTHVPASRPPDSSAGNCCKP